MSNLNSILFTDRYNHEKMLKDAREGEKIVNNTNFKKYAFQRKLAQLNHEIGDYIQLNGKIVIVTGYEDDLLIVSNITKTGRIKKDTSHFVNPCHVIKNLGKKLN